MMKEKSVFPDRISVSSIFTSKVSTFPPTHHVSRAGSFGALLFVLIRRTSLSVEAKL